MQGFQFKTVEDICNYVEMTRTEQADEYAKAVKNYVKAYGNKTASYMVYNNDTRLWEELNKERYDGKVHKFFDKSIKTIKQLVNNLKDNRIEALIKDFDKTSYVTDIMKRSLINLYDEDFIVQLNDKHDYLPIMNGKKINLKTLEITDRTMDDRFTFECAVNYTEKTPNADKYFKNLFPNEDEREFVRKCLGYMLTGNTNARCFFVFYGMGKNGKSKVLTILDKILGQYYLQCAPEVFKAKNSVGGASPELFSLMGKRVAGYSESDTADKMELNTSNIKMISGEDKIYARGLFRDPVNFKSPAKLCLATNFKPPLNAEKSIVDRLVYIFFDQCFDENDASNIEFVNEICEGKYLSEAFSWIVKGSQEYYKNYKIEMPHKFKIRTKELLESEDSIETFIKRFITKTNKSSDYIKKKVLFDKYKEFCDLNSQRCQPRSTLYNRLEHSGYNTSVLDGYDIYRNIKCKPFNDKPDFSKYAFDDLEHGIEKQELSIQEEDAELKRLTEENKQLHAKIKQLESNNNKSRYDQLITQIKAAGFLAMKKETVKKVSTKAPKKVPKKNEQIFIDKHNNIEDDIMVLSVLHL